VERGPQAERFSIGQRVGVPWLARTCGQCRYCASGRKISVMQQNSLGIP
jgi:propanol-preferring alcohol dehydrogenase